MYNVIKHDIPHPVFFPLHIVSNWVAHTMDTLPPGQGPSLASQQTEKKLNQWWHDLGIVWGVQRRPPQAPRTSTDAPTPISARQLSRNRSSPHYSTIMTNEGSRILSPASSACARPTDASQFNAPSPSSLHVALKESPRHASVASEPSFAAKSGGGPATAQELMHRHSYSQNYHARSMHVERSDALRPSPLALSPPTIEQHGSNQRALASLQHPQPSMPRAAPPKKLSDLLHDTNELPRRSRTLNHDSKDERDAGRAMEDGRDQSARQVNRPPPGDGGPANVAGGGTEPSGGGSSRMEVDGVSLGEESDRSRKRAKIDDASTAMATPRNRNVCEDDE